ncbi:MAG: sigma-54-dependent transcriptional regulator [Thermodesulfobacteriota bacterium]
MANVLIIDDDEHVCRMLTELVTRMGHHAASRHHAAEGLLELRSNPYDVVLLDVNLPDGDGLEMLPEIRRTPDAPEVIIMTGFGDARGAELAIRNGAWDYIQKTDSSENALLTIKRVIQYREKAALNRRHPVALKLEGVVGESVRFRESLDLLARAAGSDLNVLITGETGTGKDLFARAIHLNSAAAERNFVVVDCACLPDTLMESILFGYVKGAFTGAEQDCDGLITEAHRGTLFLDEIGELAPVNQKSLLRVLQERKYRPVGGRQVRSSDFRLVAATNMDLNQLVAAGEFRKDLLYRIRGLTIELPKLARRPEDIRPLTVHHVHRLCERRGIEMKSCSSDFFEALEAYSWPGNVRELVTVLDVAVATAVSEPLLFARHLPEPIRILAAQSALPEARRSAGTGRVLPGTTMSLKQIRKQAALKAEQEYLRELSATVGGDVPKACRIAGLSRSRYYELLKLHGISLPGN